MLKINKLCVSVDTTSILQDCSLEIIPGQVHVLMGPNGSGKSSLVYTLMGHPLYKVMSGKIEFEGKELVTLLPHIRSKAGIYLSAQQPQTIVGLQVLSFLKEIYSVHYDKTIGIDKFLEILRPLLLLVGLSDAILYRSVNEGFSGGEKKRFELLQMMLLKPKLALLDEIDSGVDVDGLKLIAKGLEEYKKQNLKSSLLIVTHYRRILDYVQPDVVHVMIKGKMVITGTADLIDSIEHKGYEQYAKRVE